jgi:epsilon-lactone hydrolase
VSHGGLAGRIARSARTDTWVLDHRLAPEHPFPAGRDDAVAACVALVAAGRSRLVLAGDSAGAGLAVAATLGLRRRGLSTPAGLVLLCPWLDLTLSGESVRGGGDVMLDPDTVALDARAYAGDSADLADGDLSPLFADLGDLAGLPPTLVHVAGRDILRSDAERFADRARSAGAPVEVQVWTQMWHVWHSAAPLLPQANAAIAAVGSWLQHA